MAIRVKANRAKGNFSMAFSRRVAYKLEAARDALAVVADKHMDNVRTSLSGPNYGKTGSRWNRGPLTNAGVLPVPRRTERLLKSVRITRVNWDWYRIFTNTTNVKYAYAIHFGTKYITRRPWYYWVMRDNKDSYKATIKSTVAEAKAKRRSKNS